MKERCRKEWVEYIFSLIPADVSEAEIARRSGITPGRLNKIKHFDKYKFSESELVQFVETCNGDWEVLRTIAQKDPEYLYTYWEVLYPYAEKRSHMGYVIKTCIEQSDVTRKELCEKTKIKQSYLSRIECGRQAISYSKVELIALGLNMDPTDMINRLQTAHTLKVDRTKFLNTLEKYRKKKDLTQQQMAYAIDVTEKRYEGFETGRYPVPIMKLYEIAKILSLDFHNLYNMAQKAELVKGKQDVSKITNYKAKKEKVIDDYVCTCLYQIGAIETINVPTFGLVEGHTLATLILLVLTNSFDGIEKNKIDILYYLKELRTPGNISDKLCRQECRYLPINEKFIMYRELIGVPYQYLSKLYHYSAGYLNALFVRSDKIPLSVCCEIAPSIAMPASIGIECDIIYHSKMQKEQQQKGTKPPTLNKLKKQIRCYRPWQLWGTIVMPETICKLLDIACSTEQPIDRYEKLAQLDIPQKDTFRS